MEQSQEFEKITLQSASCWVWKYINEREDFVSLVRKFFPIVFADNICDILTDYLPGQENICLFQSVLLLLVQFPNRERNFFLLKHANYYFLIREIINYRRYDAAKCTLMKIIIPIGITLYIFFLAS